VLAGLQAGQLAQADRIQLERAIEDYNKGNSEAAEPILRDLAKGHPDEFEIIETLGLVYAERGELQRAVPLLEGACRANPSSAEAAANLGVAYLKLNRIQQAIGTLRHAISLNSKNSQTQSSYGQALMAARRQPEAARAFAAAAQGEPDNPDILYNWALAEFESGNAAQATTILARIPPKLRSPQAESLCGDAEESQDHLDRAFVCFQNAAKLDPSEPNLNAVGLELLKHWSFDGAIKIYQYASEQYPASPRLQAGLGIALYGNAQYEKAAAVFSRLLLSFPSEAHARLLGISCDALKTQADECEELFRYLSLHSSDIAAASLAAAAVLEWHDTARYALARELLGNVIARDRGSADGYYNMGVLDQAEAKWNESIPMLTHAISLRPHWSSAHLRLAQAYKHLDQNDQAHREASLASHFRSEEDAAMQNKREVIKTFVMDERASLAVSSPAH